jgi:tripartite-type tricarboxylate transporter receptor subunit TctC
MTPIPVSRRAAAALLGAGLALGAALPLTAHAQAYPSKPIRIVVGFAPGGLTDAIPRLVAPHMSKVLGQQVIVENRTGAAGNLATIHVAQSVPDGYTLLGSGTGQIVISPHTSTMPVNSMTDLAHIAMVGEGDQILNINADVPAQNLAEFLALAKKEPGKLFYGSAGAGGSMHLYIEYFKMLTGVDVQAVHYKGAGNMMPDFVGGRVHMSLNTTPVIEQYVSQGKLRPILVVGKQRDPKFPNVPTAAEAGLKPLEAASNWFGLHAPKGTPQPVLQRVHAALLQALATEEVKTGLAKMAIRSVGDTPEQFAARIASDYESFGKVARTAKIRAE